MAAETATTPSAASVSVPTAPDKRRITEHDADFRHIHAGVERQLWAGIRRYARALQSQPPSQHAKATSIFIAHQMKALQFGYLAAHWEGERDYWHAFSAKHSVQAHSVLSQRHRVEPNVQRMRRALMFYGAGSISKMAREAQQAWAADQHAAIKPAKPAKPALSERITLDDAANTAMNAWLGGLTARVSLSADVAWTGLQDGYLAAGTVDPANPYAVVWWQMEPTAQHCDQCPDLAAGSPYTAPGAGGNDLMQTPGDGGTDCGAGCKCTLQYGSDLMTPSTWAAPPGADDWMQQRSAAIADAMQQRGPAAQPDEWERNRQRQIAEATGATGGMGQRAPSTQPVPDAWEIERQRQIAEALKQQRGQFGPHYPQMMPEPLTGQAGTAHGEETVWQRIADALVPGAPISEDEARQQIESAPIDGQLTEGQKHALDLFRKASLAWDGVRGALPPLDLFTAGQDWQAVNFADLTPAQMDAYAYYIEALREWADSEPLDTSLDEPGSQQPGRQP